VTLLMPHAPQLSHNIENQPDLEKHKKQSLAQI
jgi:hypothetical protein